ncbi:hypothetical protein [Gordonia sputi]
MTEDRRLHVPAECARGHELTARTTHVRLRTVKNVISPVAWECLRCLRAESYRAHYGRDAMVPDSVLDEAAFRRQPRGDGNSKGRDGEAWPEHAQGRWWTRVVFESGWQFTDPDPTPELRAEREANARALIARELDEIELRDARLRREQRAREAIASTEAIRAAMSAARGGVAC